jgi:hypothetical protein
MDTPPDPATILERLYMELEVLMLLIGVPPVWWRGLGLCDWV